MDILNSVTQLWLKQIEHCRAAKWDDFGRTASRAWDFLGKNYRELYLEKKDGREGAFQDGSGPYHKIRLNMTREFIAVMLPYLHHKVPRRQVSPRRPQVPPEVLQLITGQPMAPGMPLPPSPRELIDKLVCWLMEVWLNYLPGENGLRKEGRMAIPEALAKGRGCVWHEMVPGPFGLVPASNYFTVDHLLLDCDAEQLRDCGYIVRQRRESIWRVADRFQIPRQELKARYKSHLQRAAERAAEVEPSDDSDDDEREVEERGDICVWYEIWSRVGLGHKFASSDGEMDDDMRRQAESVGDNVWLAIMPGVPYPLNLPRFALEAGMSEDEFRKRLEWPIPFHVERAHPWPFSPLDFLPNTHNPWASSLLEGALPLQEFLDRCYSYMMDRIKATSRAILVVSNALQKRTVDTIVEGVDLELVVEDSSIVEDVRKLIQIVQFPEIPSDFYQIFGLVREQFHMTVGTPPILYGAQTGPGMRSSAEAQVKQGNVGMRPDDYAECTDDWMASISRAEGLMSRLYVGPQVVAPTFGEQFQEGLAGPVMGPLTQAWAQLVNLPQDDIVRAAEQAAAELVYTIEAGSGRRKNLATQSQNTEMLLQYFAEPLLGYAQATGNTRPFNALIRRVADTQEDRLDDLMLPVAPPPPPEGAPNEPGATPQTGPPPP